MLQNNLAKNYSLKYPKDKRKKFSSNKIKEKEKKKGKDNKPRKKLALLGLNNLNTERNHPIINSNLPLNIKDIIDIDKNKINNINNNNLIKSSEQNINLYLNKKQSNKKNKIKIFRIDKVEKFPEEKEKQNEIQINEEDKDTNKENKNPDYRYFDFNFENDQDNIAFVGEYLEEIYMNLLLEEKQATIKPIFGYMENQPEINDIMRAILIDWIIEVHLKFNLRQETLHMAIWLIDTYLSFSFVPRDQLQLLGITCLLISSKSHEIYYPQHKKLIEMTDNAYTIEEMLKMENEILKKLNFYVLCPNHLDFFNILSKMFNLEKKHYILGNYFIEYSLINYDLLKYSPSVIASSCVYLVMKQYGIDGYQKLYNNFIIKDNNPENIIKDTAKEILVLVDNLARSRFQNVKKKYMMTEIEKVSEKF